jgi:hypothetical protein
MVLTATGYVPIEANAGGDGKSPASEAKPDLGPRAASVFKTYDPDQPRVPAGNPHGGEWTSEGGSGSNDLTEPSDEKAGPARGDTQAYVDPTNDPQVISDETPDVTWIPSAEYAAVGTGTQSNLTEARPATDPNSAVQYVAATGLFWVTKNPLIDKTSVTLLLLLTQVVDKVGPRSDLTPSQYGTLIHKEFAAAVRAEGLSGVCKLNRLLVRIPMHPTCRTEPRAAFGRT